MYSKEAVSRNVALVAERMNSSLRDLIRSFALNPPACDSILGDSSLVQLRSQSAIEIIRQLKVRRMGSRIIIIVIIINECD